MQRYAPLDSLRFMLDGSPCLSVGPQWADPEGPPSHRGAHRTTPVPATARRPMHINVAPWLHPIGARRPYFVLHQKSARHRPQQAKRQ